MSGRLSAATTAELTDWMFLADDRTEAEFALLFGASAIARCVAAGVELYRSGTVRLLVVSGGFNAKLGREEALAMREAALAAGVPDADILVDDRARNTSENVANARALVEGRGVVAPYHVKLVTIAYHMRRALMTTRVGMPEGTRLSCVSYPSAFCRREDWDETSRGRAEIWSEIRKIARYLPPDPEAERYLALASETLDRHG